MVDAAHAPPPPSAEGTFAKTPFAHVLLSAQDRRRSGTVEIAAPGGETTTLLIVRGRVSKARTSAPVAYLGRILLEMASFGEEQLAQALQTTAANPMPIGQVLVAAGFVDRAQLAPALLEQLARRLGYVCRLPLETTYRFYEDYDALERHGPPSPVTIDPFPVVWSAVRERPSWDHVRSALARVGTAGVRLAPTAELPRFGMNRGELALAESLRGKARPIQELEEIGVVDPSLAGLVVYALLIAKQVELVADAPAQARPSMPSRSPLSRAPAVASASVRAPDPAAPPTAGNAEPILVGKGHFEMQEALLENAPTFAPTETGERRYREAVAYLKAGDLKRAEVAAKIAAEYGHDNAEYVALHGWIAGKIAESMLDEPRGRLAMELAIEKIDKALRIDPGHAKAYLYRGALRARIGQDDEGLADLRRSLELDPRELDAAAEIKAILSQKAARAEEREGGGWRKLFR